MWTRGLKQVCVAVHSLLCRERCTHSLRPSSTAREYTSLVICHWPGGDREKLCCQLSTQLVDSSLYVLLYPECSLCGESQHRVVRCNVAGKHCVNIRVPTRISATGTTRGKCVCVCVCVCLRQLLRCLLCILRCLRMLIMHNNALRGWMQHTHLHTL